MILRLASPLRTTAENEQLEAEIVETDPPDMSDLSDVSQKFHFQKRHLRKLLHWEMEHQHWLQLLMHGSSLPYQYVRLEDFISRRDLFLYMLWQFLGTSQIPAPLSDPPLEASCENHIENWEETKLLLNDTMSLQACNILSTHFSL